jgi:hypothetical protein
MSENPSDTDNQIDNFDPSSNINRDLPRVEKDHTICDLKYIEKITRLIEFAKTQRKFSLGTNEIKHDLKWP